MKTPASPFRAIGITILLVGIAALTWLLVCRYVPNEWLYLREFRDGAKLVSKIEEFKRDNGGYPRNLMALGIEEKETGRFIGEAGFHELRRELEPAIEGTPEMGWTLVPEVHGKGYASEALAAIIQWGEDYFAVQDFVCLIDHGNLASIRLAQKLGFSKETDTAYHGTPLGIYRRLVNTESASCLPSR